MKIRLIQVPYDSGHRNYRAGLGPAYVVDGGAFERLEAAGHQVSDCTLEAREDPTFEIRTAFELQRRTAREVRTCAGEGRFPLVVAGNCNTAVGGVHGLGPEPVGLIWFDAHGDFNTPETSGTGFLDGMGLATAVGRCWAGMMRSSELHPIPEAHAVLVGARDLDEAERVALVEGEVAWVRATAVREKGAAAALRPALAALRSRVRRAYVHVDLDVLDPGVCRANRLPAPGGLSLEELTGCIAAIGAGLRVAGGGLASIEPAFEREGRTLEAALAVLEALAAAGARVRA